MVINFLKTAYRNFIKNKIYSFINIFGLAVGMAVFILILLFVQNEKSFDTFNKNYNRIYRIVSGDPGDKNAFAGTPAPLGPAMLENISGISNMVRISRSEGVLQYKETAFNEKRLFLADPSIFDVFSLSILKGDPETILKEKNNIVITESMAEKYFGRDDPVGKALQLQHRDKEDMIVTGVIKDIPDNSHFHFDFLIRFDRMEGYLESWGAWNFYTYLLMDEGASIQNLKEKFIPWAETHLPEYFKPERLYYQPLSHIHFQYNRYNLEPAFNGKYIVIFVTIAVIILLLACINFTNLSTARASSRAREVGIKKTVGAFKSNLISQFLGESFIITIAAGFLSLILVLMSLPWFNRFTGRSLTIDVLDPVFSLGFLGLIFLSGLFSGSYPAFMMSSFKVSRALKEKQGDDKGSFFRTVLVIFQFCMSSILIICALVISKQMIFIQKKNLGLNAEQIVNIPLNRALYDKTVTLKNEFTKIPGVIYASANDYVPSTMNRHHGVHWPGQTEEEELGMWVITIDKDFMNTLQIKMLEGEESVKNFRETDRYVYILNESGRKAVGWESARGKEFSIFGNGEFGTVIGVSEDFHFRSLHHEVGPCAMLVREKGKQISLRIRSDNMRAVFQEIEKVWTVLVPNFEFNYYFLDEDFDSLYRSETKLSQLIIIFTILSLIISCLGLFSLASYTALQKTKEIGIRKVLGAGVLNVILLLSRRFARWVMIANIIAWPVAFYSIKGWLQNFAYRTGLTLWIFIFSGVLTFFIAVATVSFQSVKAALANPIKSLRYE